MNYWLTVSLAVSGLGAVFPLQAAPVQEQQHLQELKQQPVEAAVRASEQNRIKRLEQKKQEAVSYPMMEEMAAELRRNKPPRTEPDERGLWALFHRGRYRALRDEMQRLHKFYPEWRPPALLAHAPETETAVSGPVEKETVETEQAQSGAAPAGTQAAQDDHANLDSALAQYQAGQYAAALALLQDDNSPAAREMRGSILFEQGLAAYRNGDYALASQCFQLSMENGRDGRDVQFMQAWANLKLKNGEAALQGFSRLYQAQSDEEAAQGLYQSALASDRQAQLPQWMGPAADDPLRQLLRKQRSEFLLQQGWVLAARAGGQGANPALQGVQGPQLDIGVARRIKSGDSGLSQLQMELAPVVETGFALGNDAIQLRLSYLRLDSGSLPPGALFGSYSAGGSQPARTDTVFEGLVPIVRWRREEDGDAVQASLGTTPAGSPAGMTLTAELMREHVSAQGNWRVSAYRSSVRDSLLSLVGAVDPYSGLAWGGVVRNGVRAEVLQMSGGPWSASANISGEYITGEHVADNNRLAGGLGLGYDLGLPDFSYVSLGPVMGYEQYSRNLSHFTWGHGGYFSPQSFITAGVALRLLTREGGRWLLRGQLSTGWQRIVEDVSPCFPVSPAALSASCGDYAASSKQGPGSSLEGWWRYAISPSWQLGGALGWRYAQDYSDTSFLLTLRYSQHERRALYRTDLPEGMFGELF